MMACPDPSYSLNLAPCELWLFWTVKTTKKEKCFCMDPRFQSSNNRATKDIHKNILPELLKKVERTMG